MQVVEDLCLNKSNCEVPSDMSSFASLPKACVNDKDHPSKLWVKAMCSSPLVVHISVSLPLTATAVLELPIWRLGGGQDVIVQEDGRDIFGGVQGLPEPPKIMADSIGRKILRVALGSGNFNFKMKR